VKIDIFVAIRTLEIYGMVLQHWKDVGRGILVRVGPNFSNLSHQMEVLFLSCSFPDGKHHQNGDVQAGRTKKKETENNETSE
jgi:hypothetical protein